MPVLLLLVILLPNDSLDCESGNTSALQTGHLGQIPPLEPTVVISVNRQSFGGPQKA